ncbi:DUF6543 domain-containing protein [Pseudomonas sp. Marseille-Q1929]|uniref:dermonecrotic toxin domain-containing protein n=1 Tax=Pseudomonas sp. Marseille-Q1929 TaxID=2730402 RepID=UPI001A8D57E6|nr:DUF6543 domain-containing protein [Pseudomonas sp. Marseille-Q1929]MBO0495115.1 hypothetical protein [Pseudomonas sp. Marseille-Q1929]
MSITSTTANPSPNPAPPTTDQIHEGDNTQQPNLFYAWLNELNKQAQTKAVLTPEGASKAYFQEPVKRNEALDNFARNYTPMKTDNEITAEQVKAHIEEKFGLSDIDPDKTFLVTMVFKYTSDREPNKGVITQKISLTDAARLNIQGIKLPFFSGPDSHSEYPHPAPPITIDAKSRHNGPPNADGSYTTPDNFRYDKWTHGIYTEPYPGSPDTYDSRNHIYSIDPKEFKQMVWDNAYKKPYDDYLKGHWNANTRAEFTSTSTVAYLTAAHIQHHDKSLTENDRKIAMAVAGLPPDKTYLSATPDDLKQPYKADPNLETKFLTFSGFQSRILYTRDKTTERTLLYIPGQMPPMQGFDSVIAMNRWLGEQLKDPQKAEAFKIHFRPEDRPSVGPVAGPFGGVSQGVDARIDLTTRRLNEYLDEDELEEEGYWNEGRLFDGQVIENNPFEELQHRTEKAAKAATDQRFVLNSDHTKNKVVDWLKIAAYGLLVLAPLGLAFPPVGVALTVAATGLGAAELGIGIDDKINNRPGGTERIFSGAINTGKPILSEGFGIAFKPVSGAIKTAVFKS